MTRMTRKTSIPQTARRYDYTLYYTVQPDGRVSAVWHSNTKTGRVRDDGQHFATASWTEQLKNPPRDNTRVIVRLAGQLSHGGQYANRISPLDSW